MRQEIETELRAQQEALIKSEPRLASAFVTIGGLPFLPIGAFRNFHIFHKGTPHKTFTSSGSTDEVAARHSYSAEGLSRYQELSSAQFKRFLTQLNIADDVPVLSFVPTPLEWPQSSLAAMIAMFKSAGLKVAYFDEHFTTEASELLIFGTSFHHVLYAQPQFREALTKMTSGKGVTVVDTGGTKGKTRHYTPGEISEIIHATYAEAASCRVVSEYGMCELASQAWSLNAPHDGWFRANDSLTPLIVDLDERRVVSEDDEVGFLAFIDLGNLDSYMAIITEDLALMSAASPGCFKLAGRAPDASLKGCSLRVARDFFAQVGPSPGPARELRLFANARLGEERLAAVFDEYAKQDLALTLESLEHLPCHLERTRVDQRVLMILSANIPITFVYPAFMCHLRGVSEVHLQLPSIRANDPFSERVRLQIKTLVDSIAPLVAPTKLYLHDDKDLSFATCSIFDTVLVFGSDDTIQTFRTALASVELIGLGSIANALTIGPRSDPQATADICSRWLGRGCLTPVALVDASDEFVAAFVPAFDKAFSARLQCANADNRFFHRHRLLEFDSMRIHRGYSTFVVDLRDTEEMQCVSGGGCGLVYLLSQEQLAAQPALKTYAVDLGFLDPHMGKTWAEWI